MQAEGLSLVIGELYEAATDALRANDLATLIARQLDSESGVVFYGRNDLSEPSALPEIKGMLSETDNLSKWAGNAYVAHYNKHDEWLKRIWASAAPAILLGQELIETKALMQTEWADFCHVADTWQLLGAKFYVTSDLTGLIGIHRPLARDAFGEKERSRMGLLLPHIQRALQVRERLGVAEQNGQFAFDLLGKLAVGVVFVASDGRLLFANPIAETVLQTGDGLTIQQGRLRPQYDTDESALAHLMFEAAQTSAGLGAGDGGVVHVSRLDGTPLPILIAPFRSQGSGLGAMLPAAVMIFADPNKATCPPEAAIHRRWNLTAAEAKLLSSLLAGRDVSEHAETVGISFNTARQYLKQIFRKTGHHRQVDLVRSVLADPLMRLMRQTGDLP